MRYIGKIVDYYEGFSNTITTYLDEKEKTQINISGRLTKRNFIIWIIASIIFIIFDISRFKNSTILTIIFIAISIIVMIATIIKSMLIYKKLEHKPINLDFYQRQLPSNLRPAHVRMLLNDGLIDEISLIATIVDLIDKNYLELIRENSGKLSREEKFILKRTDKPTDELLEYENFVIKWFIEKYGNGDKVHQDEIKKFLETNIYGERPCELFEYFQSLVLMSFPLKKYYKHACDNKKRLVYIGLLLGGFTLFKIFGASLLIYALGCLLFASPFYVLNDEGIEEKDKWLDFKRNLIEFSNIKDKTTEMVKVWSFYLTYSIVLNIDSISSNQMRETINDNVYNSFQNSNKIVDYSAINNNEIKIIEDIGEKESINNKMLEESRIYNLK